MRSGSRESKVRLGSRKSRVGVPACAQGGCPRMMNRSGSRESKVRAGSRKSRVGVPACAQGGCPRMVNAVGVEGIEGAVGVKEIASGCPHGCARWVSPNGECGRGPGNRRCGRGQGNREWVSPRVRKVGVPELRATQWVPLRSGSRESRTGAVGGCPQIPACAHKVGVRKLCARWVSPNDECGRGRGNRRWVSPRWVSPSLSPSLLTRGSVKSRRIWI